MSAPPTARRSRSALAWIVAAALAAGVVAPLRADSTREERLAVARRVMREVDLCALVTLDGSGTPQVRTMGVLDPDDEMKVRMITNPRSRKVDQIRTRPQVVLHYLDADAPAYVTLHGTARLVADKEEIRRLWQDEWDEFYPQRENDALLIEVTPIRLEVVSASEGVVGPAETWATPQVRFDQR
jgi:general stress protein 26